MEEEHRKTDNIILTEISKLRDEFASFQKDINDRMAPIDKLKGFWSVMGFVLGAFTVIGAGLAGFVYIYRFFHEHFK